VNHYCTYFDRGYLAQGLALWASLARHEAGAQLTVLALDDFTAEFLTARTEPRLRVLTRQDLLAADGDLAAVEATRPREEFIFALTPCLVRYLWSTRPEIERLAYLDADLHFLAAPTPVWSALGGHSVLIVPHRYPPWHNDSARYGRYNVGVVAFQRDASAAACVTWWRAQCLASTALAADGGRFGDQKYLDEWPGRFSGVVESTHPGVNVAPWNWARHRFDLHAGGVQVDGEPLVAFHFAQFKRISTWWFDSGQLEYGVMPGRLRAAIYGPYWRALQEAETEVRRLRPEYGLPRRGWVASLGGWRLACLRLFWGQFWLRLGPRWFAGRLGLGRWSGHAMAAYRRWQRRAR
jgi:hypothetical protein